MNESQESSSQSEWTTGSGPGSEPGLARRSQASGRPILLRGEDVCKTYAVGRRRVEVLHGVNVSIGQGDFVALRGASGAGKSTLLHLLGGLDTPNRGAIWFGERNLASFSGRALSRHRNERVGFIFQAYHLLPELDALENVCIPGRMARHPAGEVEERACRLLERVGLGQRLEHRPYELSGGEQQRVAIARALINEPDLILADEPTGNLDSHSGEEIIGLLSELQEERRTTLVIATHDADVAGRAERALELVDGQMVG